MNRTHIMAYFAAIALGMGTTHASAHILVDEPPAGVVLKTGTQTLIEWHIEISHELESWNIAYSVTGINGPWISIAEGLPPGSPDVGSVHTYLWTVPQVETQQARIRVEMVNSSFNNYLDWGTGDFAIELLEVPAMSQWGAGALAIALMIVGTLLMRRHAHA